jgi:pimeloyl-ACP methyl ester carboxylesterase
MTSQITLSGIEFASLRQSGRPSLQYAASGNSGGQPVVMLHGYTDSWFSYSRLMPCLAAHTYQAIALSQRGHGDSDRPLDAYAADDFAADVVALLDALEIGQATLVGHSMGSVVARRVAEVQPERVSGLVLIGAIETPMADAGTELRAAIQPFGDRVPEAFAREFQASTIHAPVPDAFFEQVVAESMKLPAPVWRAVLDGLLDADDSRDLARITAPTLLLWGEHDAYFPRDEQERLVAAIPDARLHVYADTGHSPHWERPADVASDLEAFMRSL